MKSKTTEKMGVQLLVSDKLEQLATQLSYELKENRPGVFQSQYLITQTEGINSWLKGWIAKQLGISANCNFLKPNDVVGMIYRALGGHQHKIIQTDSLRWKLYQMLGEASFQKQFPEITGYYTQNDIRKIALATRVADLFDQYQVYRPDIIAEWNRTPIEERDPNNWQQYLWIQLMNEKEKEQIDKTGIATYIQTALQDPEKVARLKENIPHLYFFGIAVITPFYLSLFHELSQHIHISFYLINPAPSSYWLDDKSEKEIARITRKSKRADAAYLQGGNPLLLNWGTLIKESFTLLFKDETYINSYNDSLAQEPATPVSLLQKIQYDVYHNCSRADRCAISKEDLTDGSITLNACFTPVREVEVLYNYLVSLVDQKKEDLSARDIVVMVSDIDRYAPYIRAVFDNAPYTFPYTIADETVASGNSLFSAVKNMLLLEPDQCTAEDILEVLESAYVRNRMGITDIPFIREVLRAAGIRFGMKGNTEDDTRLISWQYGLNRILLGLCISGSAEYEYNGERLIPLDIAEGKQTEELIRFHHFIKLLEHFMNARNQSKTLSQWAAYLQEITDNLVFNAGEDDDEDYNRFILFTEKMAGLEESSNELISFEVFRFSFLSLLEQEKRTHSFAGTGITFCSLIPMRSIPFKVVAMLGMDYDKFPRKEAHYSFSLLEQEKRMGDRNVKENDKHLFLETLLSAKKYLYLSYIGRSAKDATIIPPSVLIDELADYILSGIPDGGEVLRDQLICYHPLHEFSQQYFNGSGLVNYLSNEKYRSGEGAPDFNPTPQSLAFQEIRLEDLTRFYKDPIQWYFNKALRIWYNDKEVLLPETELFELDSLNEWQIKQELLFLPHSEYENYFQKSRLLQRLPLKNVGLMALEQINDELIPFKTRIHRIIKNAEPEAFRVNVAFENSVLSGKIEPVYDHKMIYACTSASVFKYVLRGWIEFLSAIASGKQPEFYFLTPNIKKDFYLPPSAYSRKEAIEWLNRLLEHYKNGHREWYHFYPSAGLSPVFVINTTHPGLMQKLDDMKKNTNDHHFDNVYFSKAVEAGFFSEENFERYQRNTKEIFEEINSKIPNLLN